jgi:DNA repair protein RecO (recombination protein O)
MKTQIKALILREVFVGEADKLVTVLSGERGRLSIYCRGVRKVTNRHFAVIQPFIYADLVVDEKPEGEMFFLAESAIIDNFRTEGFTIESITLCSYIVQLTDAVTSEESPEPDMLRAALNALWAVRAGGYPLDLIKASFELRTAVICGFMPQLEACAVCGGQHDDGYFFDIMNGELRGRGCAKAKDERAGAAGADIFGSDILGTDIFGTAVIIMSVCAQTAGLMRRIVSAAPAKALAFAKEDIPEGVREELAAVCEKFLVNQIERGFDSLDFYNRLVRKRKGETRRNDGN